MRTLYYLIILGSFEALGDPILRKVTKPDEAQIIICEAKGEKFVFGNSTACLYMISSEKPTEAENNKIQVECLKRDGKAGVFKGVGRFCTASKGIISYYRIDQINEN